MNQSCMMAVSIPVIYIYVMKPVWIVQMCDQCLLYKLLSKWNLNAHTIKLTLF